MSKPIVEIYRRHQNTTQTMGTCTILMENDVPTFASLSLEPGWNNNEVSKSCVPIGIYELVWEHSPKYKRMLWEIKGVPGRSEAKFHPLNYYYDSEGCVGLGVRPIDMNKDGHLDITSSRDTIEDFHAALKGHTKALLIIKGKPGCN